MDHQHPHNGYASRLTPQGIRIYLDTGLHAYTTIHSVARLPHCVTPSLDYYQIRPHASTHTTTQKAATCASGRLVSLIHHGRACTGTGISTRYPSTTPDGLALGPDSPWEEKLNPGTLSHPADKILTCHSLLMPAFSLAYPPPPVTQQLPRAHDAPLPNHKRGFRGFGGALKPHYIVGAQPLDQ